jgi:hypothetical protein
MDDFSRYERMKDAGSSPRQVHEAGKADGLDPITLIRLVRKVFDLSLADVKRAIGSGNGFEARPEIRVGATARWEVDDPQEGPFLMEANVASIEGGKAHLERMKKYRMIEGGLAEVSLEGPDHGELAVSYLEQSLLERLEEALRTRNEPAVIPR